MAVLLVERYNHGALEVVSKGNSPAPDAPYNPSVVLATLKGPLAEGKVPTRNERLYQTDLWKMVLSQPLFLEALANKTMFVESDHPANWEDRLEPHIPYAVGVVREVWLDEETGTVWGIIDILDTPHGRIIKTFIDYGSKLGVSSRGSGDVINVNGQQIVDKDTYVFITWDIVARPANESSRMTESIDEPVNEIDTVSLESGLTAFESLSRQIKHYRGVGDTTSLGTIRMLVESSSIPNKEQLLEELVVVNDSKVVEVDPTKPMAGVIPEATELEKMMQSVEKRLADTLKSELAKGMRNLLDEWKECMPVAQLESAVEPVESILLESSPMTVHLSDEDKNEVVGAIDDLQQFVYESLGNERVKMIQQFSSIRSLAENLVNTSGEASTGRHTEISTQLDVLGDQIRRMTESLKSPNTDLVAQMAKLTEQLSTTQSQLKEQNESHQLLKTELETYKNNYAQMVERYVTSRCGMLGISESVVIKQLTSKSSKLSDYSIESIDTLIESVYESTGLKSQDQSATGALNEGVGQPQIPAAVQGLIGRVQGVSRPDLSKAVGLSPEDDAYVQQLAESIRAVRNGATG